MGWFTNALQAIDKPSNAIQGYFVGGMRDDETRFEGMMRGWNQEENYDFEQLWDEDLQKKGWSERKGLREGSLEKASYIASTLANLVVDPLNALPIGSILKGMGMMRAGMKAGANVEKGAMKGSMLSSIPNYIDEFYGPSPITSAQVTKMKKGKTFESPILAPVSEGLQKTPAIASYQAAKKVGGIVGTVSEGAKNIIKNTLSPESRALWRGDKINRAGMISKPLSPKGNTELEYIHKALFQSHIAQATGAVGPRQLSEQLMLKLGNRGYVPFKEGSYANKVYGFHSVMKGASGPATTAEVNAMEDIVGKLWIDNKIPISKAGGKPKLFVKNDSSPKGGQHFSDMKAYLGKKGGELDVIQKAFDKVDTSKMNLEELAEYLGKQTYTKAKEAPISLKNVFSREWWDDMINAKRVEYKPPIEIRDGNVWMNFGMKGSSITEGGVNVLSGFKPSGRMISVVSDEHNFLEKFLKKAGRYALPNRVVMMTTPTIGNIKTMSLKASKRVADTNIQGEGYRSAKKARVKSIMDKDQNIIAKKNDFSEMIENLQRAKAKPADLLFEQGRQLRAYGVGGAGLFAIPDSQN